MNNWKNILSKIVAVIYFSVIMWWILILMLFMPFMSISDMGTIRDSGFSVPDTSFSVLAVFGLFIGLSLLVPPLRRMYGKLPWLFPYVKVLLIDNLIFTIAITLLNYGYEVQSSTRHMIFFLLTIVQLVLCRALMCIYFSRRKVQYIGEAKNGQ